MKDITAACGLRGSRFLLNGGQAFIDVHQKDRDDRKVACMKQELESRDLASGLHFGHLGDDRPPLTPEQRHCVNELMRKHGLDAVDKLEAECGPR
jgi:peptide methionine sulfoxide reductase MsrB